MHPESRGPSTSVQVDTELPTSSHRPRRCSVWQKMAVLAGCHFCEFSLAPHAHGGGERGSAYCTNIGTLMGDETLHELRATDRYCLG